ncbi:MAG: SDR family oxidoreductase [Anaerolineales bacterium]|nr:SDR family oxidoreductase [Anaerolineales bacterium]
MAILQGKSLFVTGGSRGIGAAIVREALAEGAEVGFTYVQAEAEAAALVGEMEVLFPEQRCLAYQADITDTAGMANLSKQLVAEFGKLDILVNNAGIIQDAALARMSRADWDAVINTNLGGIYNTTQPLILQFVKQRQGAIINITSIAGVMGSNMQSNYAAAKAGIIGFTKSLSKEVAHFGIRVNAVAPGFIETDMLTAVNEARLAHVRTQISTGRLGKPEDIAPMVCFLGSDKATYITGQVIQIDGGITM